MRKYCYLLSFHKNKNERKKSAIFIIDVRVKRISEIAISISCLFNSVVSKFSSQNDCSLRLAKRCAR